MNDNLITLVSLGLYLGALGITTWWVYHNRSDRNAPDDAHHSKTCCAESAREKREE